MSAKMLAGLALVAALCGTRPAHAASCVINSTNAVAFGQYNVFSMTPTDAVGSLTYQCSLLLALDTITVNLSTGSSGTYGTRTMLNGANTLGYNLYMDAARTVVWGDKTNGTSNFSAILNLFPVTLQVYGRIPARQNARAGDYADTVVITLLF